MTSKEKAAIIEEAKKHEPDIWSDEYFPYWEKVYAQFKDEEDKEMKTREMWIEDADDHFDGNPIKTYK